MAVATQSTNQNHVSSSSNRIVSRPLRRAKPDLYRLASFRSWKENTQCIISPAVLAKVGFSYTGKGDKVRCEECSLEIDSWKPGMDPKQEHMDRRPQCSFVLKEQHIFTKNGILIFKLIRVMI